jgi:hypothetical protein
MPSAAQEAYAAVEAMRDTYGQVDWGLFQAEYERRVAERHRRLMTDARAAYRAMDGWSTVESREDWERAVERASEDYQGGAFLIDQLGAERHLDPTLMAVLLVLRRRLIDEHDARTAAELMLIDLAMLSYYHALRINGWVGNFAALIEHEFFGSEGPSVKLQKRYGRGSHEIQGLRVEDYIHRVGEQLLPLLDRCNRMMLRNLKALKMMREGPAPTVSIGQAGQVNVGMNQTNAMRGESRVTRGAPQRRAYDAVDD